MKTKSRSNSIKKSVVHFTFVLPGSNSWYIDELYGGHYEFADKRH